jgi:hypothetical protein
MPVQAGRTGGVDAVRHRREHSTKRHLRWFMSFAHPTPP